MDLELGIQKLLEDAEGDLGDRHEIYQRLHQMIEGLRAEGLPVPDDLRRLEHALEQEFERDARPPGRDPRPPRP